MKTLEITLSGKRYLLVELTGNHPVDSVLIATEVAMKLANGIPIKPIGNPLQMTEQQFAAIVPRTVHDISGHNRGVSYPDFTRRNLWFNTARESFFSAIEAKGYYLENHIGNSEPSKTFTNPYLFEIV